MDISGLEEAEYNEYRVNYEPFARNWYAEAYGLDVSYRTSDLEAKFYVSKIETMSELGVALVDEHGNMVKNERRPR